MSNSGREVEVRVALSREDFETLLAVAHLYEKSMGPMRHVVAFTTAPAMRKRLRFIRDESSWLERFARTELEEFEADGRTAVSASFTPRSAVAFWGRLLASLNSKRAKRKLSEAELRHRQELGDKFRDALRGLGSKHRLVVEKEIGTRRAPEQSWMRDALG